MSKRLRVRQSPVGSFVGGVFSLVFVVIGFAFVIPTFGAFGVLWTIIALVGTITSFYNAFSEHGIASEVIEVADDEPSIGARPSKSAEARLRELSDLHAKGLVSDAEYEQRRLEVLNDV